MNKQINKQDFMELINFDMDIEKVHPLADAVFNKLKDCNCKALTTEVGKLKEQIEGQRKLTFKVAESREEFKKELTQLRKALEVYANKDNWYKSKEEPWKSRFGIENKDGNGWEVAEQALAPKEDMCEIEGKMWDAMQDDVLKKEEVCEWRWNSKACRWVTSCHTGKWYSQGHKVGLEDCPACDKPIKEV